MEHVRSENEIKMILINRLAFTTLLLLPFAN